MKVGFCGLLAIAFIVLKLCGVIAWSWLWVLAPLWIPVAVVMAVPVLTILACVTMVVGALTVGAIMGLFGKKKPKPRPTLTYRQRWMRQVLDEINTASKKK